MTGRRLGNPGRIIAVMLLLGPLACDEPTTPRDAKVALELRLTAPFVTGPIWTQLDDTTMVADCSIEYRITATGRGTATWTGIELRLFGGPDRSSPIDTYVGSAAEAAESWGTAAVEAGEEHSTYLRLALPFAYAVDLVMRFAHEKGAVADSAKVRVRCEPPFAPDAAPPRVDSLVLHTPGPVEPGDSIHLSYRVSSAAGLWRTRAWVASTCFGEQAHFESGIAVRSRSVAVVVPADCPLGDSLVVGVTTEDVLLRDTTQIGSPRLFSRDTRAPALSVSFFAPLTGTFTAEPDGDAFIGDRLRLRVEAVDGGLLDHLTIGASTTTVVDTIGLLRQSWTADTSLVVRPDWLGEPSLRFRLDDRAGNVAPERITAPGGLRIHPHRDAVVRETDLSLGIYYEGTLLLAEAADVAVVRQEDIRVVSLTGGQVLRTITPPAIAAGLDVSLTGDTLFAFLTDGSIAAVDLTTTETVMTRIGAVDLSGDPAHQAFGIVALSDGNLLLSVRRYPPSSVRLILFDRPAGTSRFVDELGVGGPRLARDRTGTRVMLQAPTENCAQRLDVAAWSLGAARCDLPNVARAVPAADDRYAIGASVVSGATGALQAMDAPQRWYGPPTVAEFDPDGSHLHFSSALLGVNEIGTGTIVRVRLGDGQIVDRIVVPRYPTALRITSDGRRMVVLSVFGGRTTLAVIELP